MPCQDGGRDEDLAHARSLEMDGHYTEILKVKTYLNKYKSAYCAAMGFIIAAGKKDQFYEYAKIQCGVNVKGMYEEHQKEDISRVFKKMKEYFSNSEIELLLKVQRECNFNISGLITSKD